MLEVLTSRLFVLESLKLADCPNVGQDGMRAVAANCNATLTSIDLSRSLRVDSNALGWLAGTQVGPRALWVDIYLDFRSKLNVNKRRTYLRTSFRSFISS